MPLDVTSKTMDEIEHETERENLRTLEAVFFISARFLSMPELISLSDLNPIAIKELIEKLKEKYNKEDSAIEIIEKNGMWKMDVSQEFTHIINKLATGSSEFTKAEQETLAIIAYKQPIKQSIIIKIRGNKAYEHIKKFSDLQLIKKKKMGHTNELSLSEDFYDYFNVGEGGELKEVADGVLSLEKKEPTLVERNYDRKEPTLVENKEETEPAEQKEPAIPENEEKVEKDKNEQRH